MQLCPQTLRPISSHCPKSVSPGGRKNRRVGAGEGRRTVTLLCWGRCPLLGGDISGGWDGCGGTACWGKLRHVPEQVVRCPPVPCHAPGTAVTLLPGGCCCHLQGQGHEGQLPSCRILYDLGVPPRCPHLDAYRVEATGLRLARNRSRSAKETKPGEHPSSGSHPLIWGSF